MKRPAVRNCPDFLDHMFEYDPSSGELRWKRKDGPQHKYYNTRYAGNVAGTPRDHYLTVNIAGSNYYVHRIIWKLVKGCDPEGSVDHIDGDGFNNKWANLRDVTHDQNMWNSKLFHNNTSGYRGVAFIKAHGKWRAAISVNSKKQHLGYFESAELAHAAFKNATFKMRDEFARVA